MQQERAGRGHATAGRRHQEDDRKGREPQALGRAVVLSAAADQPTGELVLGAMPLEQRVPLAQGMVRFEAAHLTLKRPDAPVLQPLEAAVAGTQGRQCDAPGKAELTFCTSGERTQDIQPVAIQVTLGQGEPPASAAERARSYKKDKAWAGVFGLLAVLGFWWWRRQRDT